MYKKLFLVLCLGFLLLGLPNQALARGGGGHWGGGGGGGGHWGGGGGHWGGGASFGGARFAGAAPAARFAGAAPGARFVGAGPAGGMAWRGGQTAWNGGLHHRRFFPGAIAAGAALGAYAAY